MRIKTFASMVFGSAALVAGVSVAGAQASTFDGQDYAPEYTTGIQDVTFTTETGVQATVPVWSMEACADENGEFQDACVWQANVMGNGEGDSIIYLGGDEMAYISHEAAGVLLIPGQDVETLPDYRFPTVEALEAPVSVQQAHDVVTATEVAWEAENSPETLDEREVDQAMMDDPEGMAELIAEMHAELADQVNTEGSGDDWQDEGEGE